MLVLTVGLIALSAEEDLDESAIVSAPDIPWPAVPSAHCLLRCSSWAIEKKRMVAERRVKLASREDSRSFPCSISLKTICALHPSSDSIHYWRGSTAVYEHAMMHAIEDAFLEKVLFLF